MKIVAATGRNQILVEMSRSELERLTNFKAGGSDYREISLTHLEIGKELEIHAVLGHAEKLLEDIRMVGPELMRASERLARLSEETQRFNRKEPTK